MEVFVIIVVFCGVFILVWSQRPKDTPDIPPTTNRKDNTWPPARKYQTRPSPPAPTQTNPPIPESLVLTGKAYVIDGDTIRIQKTKIRIAGVDAPELNMPWGQKSKWAMVAICKGQTITVKLDGERSYDRLVGTCFLPDGRDIGAELIKQGLALDLPHFSGGKYRHLEPADARRKLRNGQFGHASIKVVQRTQVRIQTIRR